MHNQDKQLKKTRKTCEYYLIPTSRGGANKGKNMIRIVEKYHNALCKFFGNQHPLEQIKFLLYFNGPVFVEEFKKDIMDVLTKYGDKAYESLALVEEKRCKLNEKFYKKYKTDTSLSNKKNRHHLIPKSRGGANEGENIIKIGQSKHRDFHTIFGNEHPLEQFLHLLDFNGPVFVEEFKKDIMDVLTKYGEEAYKSGTLKRKHTKLFNHPNTKTRFPRGTTNFSNT